MASLKVSGNRLLAADDTEIRQTRGTVTGGDAAHNPSGEKGDGLMFVNDESNGSAGDTTMQRIEEAQKKNGASFLKNRRKFRATLRTVGHDGKEVIDKSGRSRLPAPSTLDKWLLDEGRSAVFAVAGFKRKEDRRSLVTLSYDGESGEAYYERFDLDPSEATPVLTVADACTLSYAAFRGVYAMAAAFGVMQIPIFTQEVA